jgi:hypothetical protein
MEAYNRNRLSHISKGDLRKLLALLEAAREP